jgi:hypothetical protein
MEWGGGKYFESNDHFGKRDGKIVVLNIKLEADMGREMI